MRKAVSFSVVLALRRWSICGGRSGFKPLFRMLRDLFPVLAADTIASKVDQLMRQLEDAADIASFLPFLPRNRIAGFLSRLVGLGTGQHAGIVKLLFEKVGPEDFEEAAIGATQQLIKSNECVATTFSLFSGDHPGQSIVTPARGFRDLTNVACNL
jgi:hypothetical protein